MSILLLLAAAAAGQSTSTTSRATVMRPAEPRPRPAAPAATMVYEPVATALAAWDLNGDGRTTRAEMRAGVASSFAAIQPNAAATLGYIGYSDWAERFLGDRNALPSPFEVDANGDDRISLAELQAAMEQQFDRFDRDHDGVVTRPELITIRAMAEERPDGCRGKGKPR